MTCFWFFIEKAMIIETEISDLDQRVAPMQAIALIDQS
jgi:hypothetical protein